MEVEAEAEAEVEVEVEVDDVGRLVKRKMRVKLIHMIYARKLLGGFISTLLYGCV